MDSDCEMNRQFAKRLRRQQMCSPKSIVLRETVNLTPVQLQAGDQMNCDITEEHTTVIETEVGVFHSVITISEFYVTTIRYFNNSNFS